MSEISKSIRWENEPDMNELRRLYDMCAREPVHAIVGLESLAARGSAASMWYLGDLYMGWNRYPIDIDKASYWYERAQEKGIVQATHMLGRIFIEKGNFDRAFSQFSVGATAGYAPSMFRLALMYRDGQLGAPDAEKYREWLSAAASRGHLFAKRNLMLLYLSGRLGARFIAKGVGLFFSVVGDLIRLTPKKFEKLDEEVRC